MKHEKTNPRALARTANKLEVVAPAVVEKPEEIPVKKTVKKTKKAKK